MKFGVDAKNFKILTPEEQMKWIEKQTEKVINRLPTLKRELAVFDDRSDELYNLTAEEIKLKSVVHSSQIGGEDTSGLLEYVENLTAYGDVNIQTLVDLSTEKRIDSFLENIKQVGGIEEYEYVKKLLNQLTPYERAKFVKSKYFFDTGNLSSDDFVKFLEANEVSVGTAKLEGFMASIGKKVDNGMYFDNNTRIKLGRPKKRGRKRK